MSIVARWSVALLSVCGARAVLAQDLTPRAYLITPVASNAIILTYSHLRGGLDFAGAVPITGTDANASLPIVGYYRSVDLFGRSANFTVALPYGHGDFKGTTADVPNFTHLSGFLDAVVRLSVNLIGGAAMQPAEFVKWRQTMLLGASLTIVTPTGQYDPTRLINWGSNRWGFKPEIGYSQRWDHWVLDGYGGVWFFTTNSEFYPGQNARAQKPVAAFEAHLSYDFRPRVWVSVDANYWRGGETSVNGVGNRLTEQENSRIGVTASFPITRSQSLKFSYSTGAYIRYGGNYRSLSVAWQYGWLGWPKFQ